MVLVIVACVIGIAFAIVSFVGFGRFIKAFDDGTGNVLGIVQCCFFCVFLKKYMFSIQRPLALSSSSLLFAMCFVE
jgi:hypothetical protein